MYKKKISLKFLYLFIAVTTISCNNQSDNATALKTKNSNPNKSEIKAAKNVNEAGDNLLENISASVDSSTSDDIKKGYKTIMHVVDSTLASPTTKHEVAAAIKKVFDKLGVTPGTAEKQSLDKMKEIAKALDEVK